MTARGGHSGSEVLPIDAAPWGARFAGVPGMRFVWRAWCGEAVVYGATRGGRREAVQTARRAVVRLQGRAEPKGWHAWRHTQAPAEA